MSGSKILKRSQRATMAGLKPVKPDITSFTTSTRSGRGLFSPFKPRSRIRLPAAKYPRKSLSNETEIMQYIVQHGILDPWRFEVAFNWLKHQALKKAVAAKKAARQLKNVYVFAHREERSPRDYELREMLKLQHKACDRFGAPLTLVEKKKLVSFSTKTVRTRIVWPAKLEQETRVQADQKFVAHSRPLEPIACPEVPTSMLIPPRCVQKRLDPFPGSFCKRRLVSKACDMATYSHAYVAAAKEDMEVEATQKEEETPAEPSTFEDMDAQSSEEDSQESPSAGEEDMDAEAESLTEKTPTVPVAIEEDMNMDLSERQASTGPVPTGDNDEIDMTTEDVDPHQGASAPSIDQNALYGNHNAFSRNIFLNGHSSAPAQQSIHVVAAPGSTSVHNAFSRSNFFNGHSNVSTTPQHSAEPSATGTILIQNAFNGKTFSHGHSNLPSTQHSAEPSATGATALIHTAFYGNAFSDGYFNGSFQSQHNAEQTPMASEKSVSDDMDMPEAPSAPESADTSIAASATSTVDVDQSKASSSAGQGASASPTGSMVSADEANELLDLEVYEKQEADETSSGRPERPRNNISEQVTGFQLILKKTGNPKGQQKVKQQIPNATQKAINGGAMHEQNGASAQTPASDMAGSTETADGMQNNTTSSLDSLKPSSWESALDEMKNAAPTNVDKLYEEQQTDLIFEEINENLAAAGAAPEAAKSSKKRSFVRVMGDALEDVDKGRDGRKSRGMEETSSIYQDVDGMSDVGEPEDDSAYGSLGSSVNSTGRSPTGVDSDVSDDITLPEDESDNLKGLVQGASPEDRENFPGLFDAETSTEPTELKPKVKPDEKAISKLRNMSSHAVLRVFEEWMYEVEITTNYMNWKEEELEAEEMFSQYGIVAIYYLVQYVTKISEYAELSGNGWDRLPVGDSWVVKAKVLEAVDEAVKLVDHCACVYSEEEGCEDLPAAKASILKARSILRRNFGGFI